MREDKYYGTNIMFKPCESFLAKYGTPNHFQYSIACKAKSMAEANRKAKAHGLYEKSFTNSYTSEIGNAKQIELCDKYGLIIAIDGTNGRDYVSITEAVLIAEGK